MIHWQLSAQQAITYAGAKHFGTSLVSHVPVVQDDHLLGDPKLGHNKKIQIAFITCLEILNLCNMPQPTIHV